MKRLRLPIALTIAALVATGVCAAGEIYKWTDENGNVHYQDRPTGDANLERVDIVSRDTDRSVVQARLDASREARESAEEAAAEAEPEKTREELRMEQLAREDKCQSYRDKLDTFLNARRMYRETENGEREYLDDEQQLEARAKVEEKIAEYCG
jgi:hypothetical protein